MWCRGSECVGCVGRCSGCLEMIASGARCRRMGATTAAVAATMSSAVLYYSVLSLRLLSLPQSYLTTAAMTTSAVITTTILHVHRLSIAAIRSRVFELPAYAPTNTNTNTTSTVQQQPTARMALEGCEGFELVPPSSDHTCLVILAHMTIYGNIPPSHCHTWQVLPPTELLEASRLGEMERVLRACT